MTQSTLRHSKGLVVSCANLLLACSLAGAQGVPEVPRIESLVALANQPAETDPSVIWYDDFDDAETQTRYAEHSGELVEQTRFGTEGKSLRMAYPNGSRGIGGRKVFFGDSPTQRAHVVRGDESFTDVYWRIYVKHPPRLDRRRPRKTLACDQPCTSRLATSDDFSRLEQR